MMTHSLRLLGASLALAILGCTGFGAEDKTIEDDTGLFADTARPACHGPACRDNDDTAAPIDTAADSGITTTDDTAADSGGGTTSVTIDADGDGYAAENANGDVIDCNDADAGVNPGATDATCDGIDEDCDGVDGNDSAAMYGASACGSVDSDGDGFMDADSNGNTVDCDDEDAAVNPSAEEVCGNGVDEDCDGVDDECPVDDTGDTADTGGTDTADADPTPVDNDRDGYVEADDCDDGDASINPEATEVAYDGIDQDCDGYDLTDVDCDGFGISVDCDDVDPNIHEGCEGTVDADSDGYDDTVDCDDTDASVNPGEEEIPDDGIDQDCDGADEVTLPVTTIDEDGDGWVTVTWDYSCYNGEMWIWDWDLYVWEPIADDSGTFDVLVGDYELGSDESFLLQASCGASEWMAYFAGEDEDGDDTYAYLGEVSVDSLEPNELALVPNGVYDADGHQGANLLVVLER